MDIQRVSKATLTKTEMKEAVAKNSISFSEVVSQRRTDVTLERLRRKMKEIEDQGKKLADTRSVENLKKYKKMVKDFMEDTVKNGLDLKEHRGFNQLGSSKIYKIVKEVDSKLIDLTNTVLDKEKTRIDLLGLVGEIEGMLINIYT